MEPGQQRPGANSNLTRRLYHSGLRVDGTIPKRIQKFVFTTLPEESWGGRSCYPYHQLRKKWPPPLIHNEVAWKQYAIRTHTFVIFCLSLSAVYLYVAGPSRTSQALLGAGAEKGALETICHSHAHFCHLLSLSFSISSSLHAPLKS